MSIEEQKATLLVDLYREIARYEQQDRLKTRDINILVEENRKLSAELAAKQTEVTAMRADLAESNRKRDQARAELDLVKRSEAALREALTAFVKTVDETVNAGKGFPLPNTIDLMANGHAALSPDAGHDFLTREQVRPLVDALRALEITNGPLDKNGNRPVHAYVSRETAEKIWTALAHAKELGL